MSDWDDKKETPTKNSTKTTTNLQIQQAQVTSQQTLLQQLHLLV